METPGTGVVLYKDPDVMVVVLQDGATATSNGVWVPIGFYGRQVDIHVQGITTATVQLYSDSTYSYTTNNTGTPPNATDVTQVGANITADAHVTLTGVGLWLKAKVSAYTSGTINVVAVCRR